ncbi:MAG: family 43 glycosylhydrolase [Bryobacterales bacterium]|nr:family 43 glycosylhydrolase [Bryobacterales bacterium]
MGFVFAWFALLLSCASGPEAPPPAPVPSEWPAVILNGDFADPTIVRDGEDFYLTHSSFNAVPGLPIWHSRNLKEWRMITRALNDYVGNIWAPDIVKHEQLFYIYFPAAGTNWVGDGVLASGSLKSKPVDLKVGGIDPGHVAGPDGKRYLHLSAGKAVELAADGLSVVGEPKTVYEGWKYPADWVVECFCLESPKLAMRDGRYYLTSAQGGTAGPATSHMVVLARSDSPLGPWENSPLNPVLRTASAAEKWWSKGHGTPFDAGNDKWFLVYHAFENGFRTLGRQVLMEPIEWTPEGWYRTARPDSEPFEPRLIRNHQILSDDFSGAELKLQWQFDGSQLAPGYLLKDGQLTLPSLANRMAVLYTQTGDHDYEASVRFMCRRAPIETGLVAYFGPENFVGIGRGANATTLFRGGEAVVDVPHRL